MSKTLAIKKIPNNQRNNFLPKHFGNVLRGIEFENFLYNIADEHLVGYEGGMWNFYEVLVGDTKVPLMLINEDKDKASLNGAFNEIETNGFTASLAIFQMALNHFMFYLADKGYDSTMKKVDTMYNTLREYIFTDNKQRNEKIA